ncbi:hypothetical protein TNCT_287341 [Trichonephila clavata]|uniref:Uncharacterized protein n=1 Tax=Trichonephila clavata TaxID=2740835 RepID=A0A8X6KQ19_TRICU|nr:hypothetical protein TNCT_287341 [Trichonephila clavata]
MHHPHTKQWFKTVMNILRTLTSNTGFHTTRRSLRPLVGLRIALGNRYREKSIVFTPPPLPHRGFRFPAVQHTPCLLDYKAMLQTCQWTSKTFQDAMDPFTNKENCQDAHSKKSYTKAGPLLRITVPRFDITGQPFRSHPCHGPIHYSTKLCF